MKKKKRETTEGIELPYQEKIRTSEKKKSTNIWEYKKKASSSKLR